MTNKKRTTGMKPETYIHIKDNLHLLELDLENGIILNFKGKVLNNYYNRILLAGRQVKQHQVFAVVRWGEECIGKDVNHINENRGDNSWDNLELLTHEENLKARSKGFAFEKYNKQDIQEMCILYWVDGVSQKEISLKYNCTPSYVNHIVNGKSRGSETIEYMKNYFEEAYHYAS